MPCFERKKNILWIPLPNARVSTFGTICTTLCLVHFRIYFFFAFQHECKVLIIAISIYIDCCERLKILHVRIIGLCVQNSANRHHCRTITQSLYNDPWPRLRVTHEAPALVEKMQCLCQLFIWTQNVEAWGRKFVAVRAHSLSLAAERIVSWFTGKTEQLAGNVSGQHGTFSKTALTADHWLERSSYRNFSLWNWLTLWLR